LFWWRGKWSWCPVLSKLFFWQGETKDVRSHSIPTINILSLLVWWSGLFNHKYWKAHDLQIKDPLVLFLLWRKGWGVEHMWWLHPSSTPPFLILE
jgi:hypothetical protein